MASKLENQVALGLHLSAGASDGYLTSAEYIYDETKQQSIQATIDEIKASTGDIGDFTINGQKISSNPVLTGADIAVSSSGGTTVDEAIAEAKKAGTDAQAAIDAMTAITNEEIDGACV